MVFYYFGMVGVFIGFNVNIDDFIELFYDGSFFKIFKFVVG